MIPQVLQKAIDGEGLTGIEARAAMEAIMNGEATPAQIGGFLIAMRMKGESVTEIASFARVMREKATKIDAGGKIDVLDTCGTGGDSSHTFNISTTAAFVAAGAGITVAKHGNRSVSSKSGSADVLKALGINIELEPARVSECLRKAGIGFLFAPLLHSSMKYAIGPRREMKVRTFFNILGPMTNPAGANRQLIGVYDKTLVETIAGVLADLGSERAFVVHGSDGLDEITTTGETFAAEVKDGKVRTFTISPADYSIKPAAQDELIGGDAETNAAIFTSILAGEKGPKRDIVLLNSAYAICAGGRAETPEEGFGLAEKSIDSGEARGKYEALKELSNS